MENIYLVCPLNLGDYFVCNAIVRHYLRLSQMVTLPVVPQYMETIKCLYADHDNCKVIPYLGQECEAEYIHNHNLHVVNFRTIFEVNQLPLKGAPNYTPVPINWHRQIYEHFDWCYSRRYQDFQLPMHIANARTLYDKLNPHDEPYVLFHKYTSHHVGGIQIPLAAWRPSAGLDVSFKIIEVEIGHTVNMLDYVELITHAKEIHVVPSSFHCLVDSMTNQTQAELFYHDVRLNTIMQVNHKWNMHRWHIVNYGEKQ